MEADKHVFTLMTDPTQFLPQWKQPRPENNKIGNGNWPGFQQKYENVPPFYSSAYGTDPYDMLAYQQLISKEMNKLAMETSKYLVNSVLVWNPLEYNPKRHFNIHTLAEHYDVEPMDIVDNLDKFENARIKCSPDSMTLFDRNIIHQKDVRIMTEQYAPAPGFFGAVVA